MTVNEGASNVTEGENETSQSPLLKRRKISEGEGIEEGRGETIYPVKVVLLMHPLEYHRASNSGKLLLCLSSSLCDVEVRPSKIKRGRGVLLFSSLSNSPFFVP